MTQVPTLRSAPQALVIHPEDRVARLGAMVTAAVAVVACGVAVLELVAGSTVGVVVGIVVAALSGALTAVVVYGSSRLEVTIGADEVRIGDRRLPTAEVTSLRRHSERSAGLDLMDADGGVLYAMPAWFTAEQESAFATALGRPIEEPARAEPVDAATDAPEGQATA